MKINRIKFHIVLILGCFACHPKQVPVKAPDISRIASSDTNNWRPLGPFGSPIPLAKNGQLSPHGSGRFMCVLPDASNPSKFIIGHATSGMFKTNNAGLSWDQVMHTDFCSGVFKIIRFKTDPKHLLAASALDIGNSRQYGFGIIESFDDGQTWKRNSLKFDPQEYENDQARDLAILDSKKEKSIIAVTAHKIHLSVNSALTWSVVHESSYNLKHVVVDRHDSRNVVVCGNGVLLSQDGGINFTDITQKINQAYGLSNHKHANYQAAFSIKHKNRLYIVAQNQSTYLLKSNLNDLSDFEIVNNGFTMLNPSRLVFDIQWHPQTKSETLWIGATRLVKSLDDGKSFVEAGSPLNGAPNHIHDDMNDIAFSETGDVWVCTDGGVDFSSDGGKNWKSLTDQSVNLNTSLMFGFDRSPDNTIMAGTQDNGVFMYKNGRWTCLPIYGDGGRVVASSDSDDFYGGVAQINHFFKDGGNTIMMMHAGTDRTGHDFRLQYVKESGALYIANMHLYKKVKGKYFEIISSMLESDRKIKAFWVNPKNENEIWLAKDDPTWGAVVEKKLYQTLNGGRTWIDRSKSLSVLMWRSITDLHINRRGEIAVSLEAFDKQDAELNKVYISQDGGRTFRNMSDGLPNLPVNVISSVNGKWICGNNDGVYILTGKTWKRLGNQFPKTIVTELRYYESDGMLLASTFGRGLWAIAIK